MKKSIEFTPKELEAIENLRQVMEAYEMLDENGEYYLGSDLSVPVEECYITKLFNINLERIYYGKRFKRCV